MDTEVKVAIVGPGHIGRVHRTALDGLPVEMVGYVSLPGKDPVKAVSPQDGSVLNWGERYDSTQHLLESGKPDAVWVCTTPNTRGDIERQLIAAGTPFFLEKPLALDHSTTEVISDAIDHAGIKTAVGYHWRKLDMFRSIKEDLKDKNITQVKARWYDSSVYNAPPWWFDQKISGGPVLDQLSHMVDITRFLAGEFDVVQGQTYFSHPEELLQIRPDTAGFIGKEGVATQTRANVIFKNGAKGTFEQSSLLPCTNDNTPFVKMRISCDDGTRLYADVQQESYSWNGQRYIEEAHRVPNTPAHHFAAYKAEDMAFINTLQNPGMSDVYSYRDAIGTQRACVDIINMAEPVGTRIFTHNYLNTNL